jgi:hypothetical protein
MVVRPAWGPSGHGLLVSATAPRPPRYVRQLPGNGETHKPSITDLEVIRREIIDRHQLIDWRHFFPWWDLAAAQTFMDSRDGGVLITGDHFLLGAALGNLPRAGKMRQLPAPDAILGHWNSTLRAGANSA